MIPATYRPFPHLFTAIQLTTENLPEVATWCDGGIKGMNLQPENRVIDIYNKTFDTEMRANVGDWIIRNKEGDFVVSGDPVFQANFTATSPSEFTLLDIGAAINAAKHGRKIARAGWNGKGMFVYYVPANSYPAQTGVAKAHYGENAMVPYNAYLALKGVDGTVSTWVPSINDTLATDWSVVE